MSTDRPLRPLLLVSLLALAVGLGVSACDEGQAWGDPHALIVASTEELWLEIEEPVYTALSPRIFTVRPERTFRVTHRDPRGPEWDRFRRFRQVLLVGSVEDPWMQEGLSRIGEDGPYSPPQILQGQHAWARGQSLTALLLPPGGGAEELEELLEPLHDLLDDQYRSYARSRMFVSGRDTAQARSLMENHGFRLLLPDVYRTSQFGDSIFVFRNDNPDPSELIRQATVTWRSPIPEEFTEDDLVDWRVEVADHHFSYPQVVEMDQARIERGSFQDRSMLQVQAIWANPPDDDFPAGGPFIARVIECPDQDRLYLLDTWLYAPGTDKYEYMIQLETILDSFRCGG